MEQPLYIQDHKMKTKDYGDNPTQNCQEENSDNSGIPDISLFILGLSAKDGSIVDFIVAEVS